MSKRRETLVSSMTRRAGPLQAFRCLTFLVSWQIAQKATADEGPLTLTRYSEWWRQSRTTTWREQRAFEACFPGHRIPGSVVDQLGLVVPDVADVDQLRSELTAQLLNVAA